MGSVPAVAVRAKRELCADASGAAHEDLAATASRVDRWVLIEYRGYWDRDVLGGSLLSQALKEHLREQLERLGHSRLLFVKRPERRTQKRRMLFVGSSRPGEERFYALEFDHHDDLIGYDFASALLGGDTPGVPVEHPLFGVHPRATALVGLSRSTQRLGAGALVGEHTTAILQELGYSDEAIARLRAAGKIGG